MVTIISVRASQSQHATNHNKPLSTRVCGGAMLWQAHAWALYYTDVSGLPDGLGCDMVTSRRGSLPVNPAWHNGVGD